MSGPDPAEYAQAFQTNCPGARLTQDERDELRRLFYVAINHARSTSAKSEDPNP